MPSEILVKIFIFPTVEPVLLFFVHFARFNTSSLAASLALSKANAADLDILFYQNLVCEAISYFFVKLPVWV